MKYWKIASSASIVCLIVFSAYQSLAVVNARNKTPGIFGELLAERNTPLKLEDIPKNRIHQLLLIEDPGFYHHNGIDFSTPGAGLTTITQGMVKYLYFDHFKPGIMKIEQSLIAWLAVGALVNKNDQLTVFINTAYLGTDEGVVVRGFAMAAKRYFGKSFEELSNNEYLSLVAMLIGPDAFSIKHHPGVNGERVKRIKDVLSGEYKPDGLGDVYYGQNI
ncbi:MAG: transglycosylase domain-containing protein [Candidatus Thiodiazotropha sp. (ex Dulcina madagascariensis)]|nr:transglycosylase domain-containing protein [Candidatus Thiodiazotropha sp. (ex Dulcina madagascariensis)]MCU7926525.1 transglycosylase domain-containing protein [Candidatus Thiodiazotropha sp. (ex Dulcina madagascariensis)]